MEIYICMDRIQISDEYVLLQEVFEINSWMLLSNDSRTAVQSIIMYTHRRIHVRNQRKIPNICDK